MKVLTFKVGSYILFTPKLMLPNCFAKRIDTRRYHFLLSGLFRKSVTGNKKAFSQIQRTYITNQENEKQKVYSSQSQGMETPSESVHDESTHFGNKNVTKEEKAEKVHDVFENVADKYDLMNDLMSGGIHRLWKDTFVSRLCPTPGIKLLDVAGGTGDITFRVLQHIRHEMKDRAPVEAEFSPGSSQLTSYEEDIYQPPGDSEPVSSSTKSKVTVCDISERMLDVGRKRAADLGYHDDVEWVCGNAEDLPFDSDTFDAYTIAYGMRNVVNVDQALREAYRVLKPGGRFMCLEFSRVNNSVIRSVYDLYSFQVIPVMGQLVAGDWDSYQYLVESIRKFPDQETYKTMIEAAGFRRVTFEELTFGITAIHSGFKI